MTQTPTTNEAWPVVDLIDGESLTYAEMDEILEETGVSLADPDVSMGRKAAVIEWVSRRRAGQDVDFEEVYHKGSPSLLRTKISKADPTSVASA